MLLFLGMWELPLCCACTFKKKFIPPLEGSGKEPTDISACSLPHLLTSYCPFWKGVTLGIFFLDKLLPLTPLEAIFCVSCFVDGTNILTSKSPVVIPKMASLRNSRTDSLNPVPRVKRKQVTCFPGTASTHQLCTI